MRTTRQKSKSRDKENKKRHARREAKKLTRPKSDGFRKLTLASGEWKWKAGRGSVVMISPEGTKTVIDHSTFLGVPQHVVDNLQDNNGLWVLPGMVREYIEKNLVK